ncbi:MAG: AMP-binding protein, partial [Verrucomicrobia bacterium]|nr:AMP-binding protein [Verrucomicrobiota bacterium]
MIQDARLFLELNKLEEAEAKLSEAKALDPESDAVWYYLSLLNQKKFQRETRKREITSQEKMIEVSNYWDPGLNKNELPISNTYASTNLVHTGLGRQKILSKMDRIVLDEVSFDGLPLSEVVQFLYDEAKERDAEDEGINFTISNHMDTGVQATNFGGVPYTYEMLKKLRFERVSLPDLKYITQAGGKLNKNLVLEFNEICQKKDINFIVMYGQTEATARMSYLPPESLDSKAGSIGIAIPNGKFSIKDENGCEIQDNDVSGE